MPRVITVDELLCRAGLDDELPAGEEPLLVVDLSGGVDVDPPSIALLASMPCVIVGVGEHGSSVTANAMDVVTDDPAVVAAIERTVTATPRSATALALLLRSRDRRTIEEALVAESTTYSMLQAGPEFAAWLAAAARRPAAADAEPPVLWALDGSVLRVVLNRPARHNAYSVAMRDALVEALRVALADPTLSVVLSGAGPSFCSGGDLGEFGSFEDPASAHLVRLTRSAARVLARIGDRVEAHLHGSCLGAGVELPAFAGRVVAHPDATFGLPELTLGLVPGAGGTASLPPRIGRQRTAQLALSGERIDATTALAWGLVDEVADGPPPASTFLQNL